MGGFAREASINTQLAPLLYPLSAIRPETIVGKQPDLEMVLRRRKPY